MTSYTKSQIQKMKKSQKWQYDASLRSLHLHFVTRIIWKELGRVNEPLTKD